MEIYEEDSFFTLFFFWHSRWLVCIGFNFGVAWCNECPSAWCKRKLLVGTSLLLQISMQVCWNCSVPIIELVVGIQGSLEYLMIGS